MIKVAILVDGGYFLKRLPTVRPDIDATDPGEVVRSVWQLVRRHLTQLNEVWGASDPLSASFPNVLLRCPTVR